jgi:hypothetical protein
VQVDSAIFSHVEGDRQLRRSRANRLSLSSSIKCSLDINDYLCLVSTADGTLLLIDLSQNKLECETKSAFIPTSLKLHPDKVIVMTSNDKGLMQCWDIALNPIKLLMTSEADHLNHGSSASGNVLDVGIHFNRIPIGLCDLVWSERSKIKTEQPSFMEIMAFNYLLLRFHNGPLALMRLSGGVYGSGSLGPNQIINQHLKSNNFHAVLLLLNQMDWARQGEAIMISMNTMFHKLFRQPILTRENESLMEMCLGLFYAPNRPIAEDIMDEFSEQVHDITRKFFHR